VKTYVSELENGVEKLTRDRQVDENTIRELSGEKDACKKKAEESVEYAVLKDSFVTLKESLERTQGELELQRAKVKGVCEDEKMAKLEKDLEVERERSRELEEKLANLAKVLGAAAVYATL
jgi:predicted  nucleic acid-binding Zn-ribbon protein